jgi:hypothetical protein
MADDLEVVSGFLDSAMQRAPAAERRHGDHLAAHFASESDELFAMMMRTHI